MDAYGYSESEKIKILYEDSLKDIRALTARLEGVAEKVQTSSVTVHEIEMQVETSITKAGVTLQALADKEMKRAGQQAILTMADLVGEISQQLAGDAAASERQKSLAWAAGSMTVFGVAMYGAGLTLGSQSAGGMGWGYLTVLPLGVGIVGGLFLSIALSAGGRLRPKEDGFEKSTHLPTAQSKWTEQKVRNVANSIDMSKKITDICVAVMTGDMTIGEAAKKHGFEPNNLQNFIKKIEDNQ